MTHAKAYNIEI